jgi:2-amino-4-hydroxy-6-hydroxymethyldihydropteridine diphosphokinase
LARSRWWRSAAWPDPNEPEYRNGVALVEASGDPAATLTALLAIERAFGRDRGRPNAPRTLDLDLVAFGRLVLHEPGLTLPHPRAHKRAFVMGPLAEIAPHWRHPASGKTARELAAAATVGRDAAPSPRT